MTQPLTFVVLSTDLDNFKAIRSALTAEAGAQLLAGGNDADQLYEEIVRLKPSAAIIALSEKSDGALRFIERLASECPSVALISAAHNNSPDVILQSLRAGAREFLRLPISADELRTVLARVATFHATQVQKPKLTISFYHHHRHHHCSKLCPQTLVRRQKSKAQGQLPGASSDTRIRGLH